MTELSDQTLLAYWYRSRNAEAFHILAARHARMVYATALRVLRDAQEAQDVSQESFLALAQAKRPPSRNVAAWLHRTAYRAALDAIRTRTRRNAREHEYSAAQPAAAHPAWDDVREHVDEAVAALPDKFREPLVRFFFEQESHAAIAASLGIPRQTVTYRIGQGIAQVRERLSAKGIVAPAGAAFAALVQENSASALPMGAAAEIGRVALVASPSVWAVVGTYTGGAAVKVAAAILVVVGAATAGVVGITSNATPEAETPDDIVAQVPGEAAAPVPPPADPLPVPGAAQLVPIGNPSTEADATANGEPVATLASAPNKASVAGVVLLPDGKPYAGATVWVISIKHTEEGRWPEGTHFRIVADEAGRFEQTGILPDEYGIYVTEPDTSGHGPANEVAKITLKPGEDNMGLRLYFGLEGDLTISGIVVDTSGKPVPGVNMVTPGQAQRYSMTDEKGEFTLTHLPDDQIVIFAHHISYANGVATARAGDQNVRIELVRLGAIAGRVIDAKTREPINPFKAAFMERHMVTYRDGIFQANSSFANAEGTFMLERVPSGDATVVVLAEGYAAALEHVTVEEGKTLEGIEIALEVSKPVVLSGHVVTADGAPVSGANVYTHLVGLREFREKNVAAVTDAKGAFEIYNPPPHMIFAYAWHPGYAPATGELADDTIIVLKRPGKLTAEVFSGGLPLPKVRLRATSFKASYAGGAGSVATDENGQAILDEVAPGDIRLEVEVSDFRSRHEMLHFEPGEEKSIRIDLAAAEASVEGAVMEAGAPAPGGIVELFVDTAFGRELLQQHIAPDGSFRFATAPLGKAQLVAKTGEKFWRAFSDDVPLVAGQVTEVVIDATMACELSGVVGGVGEGEAARVMAIRGSMNLDQALEAATQRRAEPLVASMSYVDENGTFLLPVQKSGTYTLLVTLHPGNNPVKEISHDLRVVEIPESGELNVDFNLSR